VLLLLCRRCRKDDGTRASSRCVDEWGRDAIARGNPLESEIRQSSGLRGFGVQHQVLKFDKTNQGDDSTVE
jgi:hypothetical protein